MSENDELVKRLRELLQADLASTSGPIEGSLGMLAVMPFPQFDRITDERKEAAQAIERLAQERNGWKMAHEISEAAKGETEQQLAEARAREGRLASHLCQALGQWQMYAEMQEDCDLSRDDTPEADLYRLAHNVLVDREALAAPAPGKDSEKVTKP